MVQQVAGGAWQQHAIPRPDDVHVLMGEVDADDWIERPKHPAVIAGTQDMLLSRADPCRSILEPAATRHATVARTCWPTMETGAP